MENSILFVSWKADMSEGVSVVKGKDCPDITLFFDFFKADSLNTNTARSTSIQFIVIERKNKRVKNVKLW